MNVIDKVTTGRCSVDFFRGGSKVNFNIGNHDFWINSLRRSRPQYVVVWGNERTGNSILLGCDIERTSLISRAAFCVCPKTNYNQFYPSFNYSVLAQRKSFT